MYYVVHLLVALNQVAFLKGRISTFSLFDWAEIWYTSTLRIFIVENQINSIFLLLFLVL